MVCTTGYILWCILWYILYYGVYYKVYTMVCTMVYTTVCTMVYICLFCVYNIEFIEALGWKHGICILLITNTLLPSA